MNKKNTKQKAYFTVSTIQLLNKWRVSTFSDKNKGMQVLIQKSHCSGGRLQESVFNRVRASVAVRIRDISAHNPEQITDADLTSP